MKGINRQNYPPILVLWLLTGCASTLTGAFMSNMVLLGGGVAAMLLEVVYIYNMPKPQQGRLIT